jgi:hypothetical protein
MTNMKVLMGLLGILPLVLVPILTAQNAYATHAKDWQQAAQYVKDGYIYESPYGYVNVVVTIDKLHKDGSSSYDWYKYKATSNMVPGKYAFGSDYRNKYIDSKHTILTTQTNPRDIVDHGPEGTQTGGTASVSLSAQGITVGWSWGISDVKVTTYTDYLTEIARWVDEVQISTAPAAVGTYSSHPGFIVRAPQNLGVNSDGVYKAQWQTSLGISFTKTSATLFEDAWVQNTD